MKNLAQGRGYVFSFTLAYIVLFSAGFIYGGDFEFAIYTVVMLAALIVTALIARNIKAPNGFLWALSIMGILHMAGGGIHVGSERLYAYRILNIYASATDPGLVLFRYDQLVHMVGYAVIAVSILYALRRGAPALGSLAAAALAVCAAMAIGSLNELGEFTAVLMLPSTGVGDYFNTMLDLSFNTIGAVIGVIGYQWWIELKNRSK
jgi:uncharacterized membrane protein YjdF